MPVPTVMQVPARTVRNTDMILLDDEGNSVEDGQPREWKLPPEINSRVWLKTVDTFYRGKFIFPFELNEPVWVVRPVPTEEEREQAANEAILSHRQRSADKVRRAEDNFMTMARQNGVVRAMDRYGDQVVRETAATEDIWAMFDKALEDGVQGEQDGEGSPVPHTPTTALEATLDAVRAWLLEGRGGISRRDANHELIRLEAYRSFLRYEGRGW